MMMKAAILKEPGKLDITNIPVPLCPDNGVLIKVKACGICTADLKMIRNGHRALVYPRILGHEISGVVAQSKISGFHKGDRVQIAPGLRCGTCLHCMRKEDNQCLKREIIGFTYDGGFAEYIVIPLEGDIKGRLNLLPSNISYAQATLGEPLACCINAQERAKVTRGDTVLIMGAGTLGLLNSLVARLNFAENILIADPFEKRQNIAKQDFADTVLNPFDPDFFDQVMSLTQGRGVDVIIFASSATSLDNRFINLLARGGRVSIFSGMPVNLSKIELDLSLLHYKEILITGAYGSTADQNSRAVSLIASETSMINKLITLKLGLDNIIDGFNKIESMEELKVIVEMDNG